MPTLRKLYQPKHLLTGEELSVKDISQLLVLAQKLKKERVSNILRNDLCGYQLALLFDKPSLRTRFSFTVAMRELGGEVIESIEATRKKEHPADQAKVLGGYCHGVMIRTHSDQLLTQMSCHSAVPIINGLSALHHPCQILSDLLTLTEIFGSLNGLTLSYIGDGNNILHSLLLLAPQMGVTIHYCCPPSCGPDPQVLTNSMKHQGKVKCFSLPKNAVKDADIVYTDVWTSMGFESEKKETLFLGFQVNESLMSHAKSHAVFMHCLPMERGKETSQTLPDQPCSIIFTQSENRLHMQKALLLFLLKGHAL